MMENPVWRDYVLRYNVLYHDYGYNDKELEILLGAEPPRYIEGSDHGFTNEEWERADEVYEESKMRSKGIS